MSMGKKAISVPICVWCYRPLSRGHSIYCRDSINSQRGTNKRGEHIDEYTGIRIVSTSRASAVYEERICRKCGMVKPRRAFRGDISRVCIQCKIDTINRMRQKRANMKGEHTDDEWLELCVKYGYKCLRCQEVFPINELIKDHVIPVIYDGTDSIDNIQPLCDRCNCIKGKKSTDYRRSESSITREKPLGINADGTYSRD